MSYTFASPLDLLAGLSPGFSRDLLPGLPVVYVLGAAAVWCWPRRAWALGRTTTVLAFGLAAGLAAAAVGGWGAARHDALGAVVALLVTGMGWGIARFSQRYLQGEIGQPRYVRHLLLTLGAVSAIVTTGHLAVIALAWVIGSLAMHQLLTFYPQRAPARVTAHKKFLSSRLADACMLGALVLVWRTCADLSVSGLAHWCAERAPQGPLPLALQAAAVLIVLAVVLKSAQLPVHGWLIQVMEAPTPVSALLHAGVVNIGAVVIMRVAPLMMAVPAARWTLALFGMSTAVGAGLVMMTRISIKVRLAWSTCAQMGFMLTECALGWFDLALLHLVTHSLYKAYAFLSAGEAVQAARLRTLASRAMRLSPAALWARAALAPVAAALVLWACERLWQRVVPGVDLPATALLIAALGLSPLLWKGWWVGLLRVGLLCQLYLLGHLGAAAVTAGTTSVVPVASAVPDAAMALWVAGGFLLLYGWQTVLVAHPQGAWSRRLYPLAYAGFHLDEWFTRLTFRLWPARMPRRPAVVGGGAGPMALVSGAPAARPAAARGGSL